MKHLSAAAALAAALATPAAAGPPVAVAQDLVYSVSASHADPGKLDATCVFRPDRWTADYGPTYVDAIATSAGPALYTEVRCRIYTWGTLSGEVVASEDGPVVAVTGERTGTVGFRPHLLVCVDAVTHYVVDVDYSVSRCVAP